MDQPAENEIKSAWRALSSEKSSDGWSSIAVICPDTIKIRAGRRFPYNTESLLIRFNNDVTVNSERFPRGKEFCLEEVKFESEDFPGKWIALFREKEGSLELFSIMVTDIVELLYRYSSQNHKTILDHFIARINAWQEFMKRSKARLGSEAEIGLFGELYCLKMFLDSDLSFRNAVEGWMGPERGIQDFNFGSFALEVKTTAATEGFPVKVNSLEQLDDSSIQPVYLFGCRLETDSHGQTLSELIQMLRDTIKSDKSALSAFERKILFSGYRMEDQAEYFRKFRVREESCFQVDDNFPRLTPYNVPAGILKASYEINLESVQSKKTDFEQIIQMIGLTNGRTD